MKRLARISFPVRQQPVSAAIFDQEAGAALLGLTLGPKIKHCLT